MAATGTPLDYALAYARAGFPVLPLHAPVGDKCSCGRVDCPSPAKHPRTEHGLSDATTEPAVIHSWWTTWPDANVGVVLPHGYAAVDVDSADAIASMNGELPPTATARTGRVEGGRHYLYRTTRPVPPRVGVRPHVDVRGPGSYIVAPPSRHMSGAEYAWLTPPRDGIAEAPAWLYDAAPERPTATQGEPVPEGRRNDHLARLAGALRHHGASEATILASLVAANNNDLATTLPDAEVRTIARSVARYAPAERGPVVELGEAPARSLTPFPTAAELAAETPAEWRYVVTPWAARGAITELDGRPKSAGKTTLLLHLIGSVLDGAPFLGRPTAASPVVLLTEQSRRSLVPTLRALGLDRDDLLVLTWPDAVGTTWPAIVDAAVSECVRIGARLLAIDTLSPFVGLAGEGENDAAVALAAMRPLQVAAQEYDLAILLTRHDRKGSGEVAESGRGSNAWSGAVDCVVALRRQANPVRPTIRELEAISRRGDVPDEPLLIELTEAGYVVLGSSAAVAFDEARSAILECLSAQQDVPLGGQTLDEIAEALERPRATLQRAMKQLLESGEAERTGKGRAGDPYRYRKPAAKDRQTPSGSRSAQHPPLRGEVFVGQTPDRPRQGAADGLEQFTREAGTDAAWSRVAPSVGTERPA